MILRWALGARTIGFGCDTPEMRRNAAASLSTNPVHLRTRKTYEWLLYQADNYPKKRNVLGGYCNDVALTVLKYTSVATVVEGLRE